MHVRLRTALVRSVALAAVGCATPDALVFTTYTKIGVDISATGGQPTEAVFGYKRFEGAIIPVDPARTTNSEKEVHSVFAGICVDNGWLSGLKLGQVFATGEAAQNVAADTQRARAASAALNCAD